MNKNKIMLLTLPTADLYRMLSDEEQERFDDIMSQETEMDAWAYDEYVTQLMVEEIMRNPNHEQMYEEYQEAEYWASLVKGALNRNRSLVEIAEQMEQSYYYMADALKSIDRLREWR